MNLFVINLKNLNDYRSYDHFIFANNESIIVTWETKNTQKSFHFTLNNKILIIIPSRATSAMEDHAT